MTSRPWDILELVEGDVRRTGTGTYGLRPHRATRTIRKVPTVAAQLGQLSRQSDRWTRALIMELARLGYDVASLTDTHVYLRDVGRGRMLITLRHSGDFPIEIERVTFGRESWTARQAALWLRKRAAR